MLLNTFAPPFRLVGGYFIAGLAFLFLSIFAFFAVDLDAVFAPPTAGFLHLFFVGFVISIIMGALYQLTSVILEKPFFTIKGAFVNLFIYALSLIAFVAGLFTGRSAFMHAGGGFLFLSLLFFGITYALSFIGNKKRSFAAFALLVSAGLLIVGITLGFCLVLALTGALAWDFETLLFYHVYFVIGFVFFVAVGVASVLLPMFALVHDLKFTASKISLGFYALGGAVLVYEPKLTLFCAVAAILCFVYEAAIIIKRRVRKAFDYWNVNIVLALVSFCGFCAFAAFGQFSYGIFWLIYGFLYAFIVAHLYKIAPFLIWYHYVSPFVGKAKIPLLDDMIIKKPTYAAICANVLALVFFTFGLKFIALFCMLVSVSLVALNMAHVFKFTNFGVGK